MPDKDPADKKKEDDRKKELEQKTKEQQDPKKVAHEKEREQHAKEHSPYPADPPMGSTQPGYTSGANPARQNVPLPTPTPTDDPMATPDVSSAPNPPSAPGGDVTGEPNVSATGEKLPPEHPDYRADYEGKHGPDHRTAEEKKEHPLDDKGQADNDRLHADRDNKDRTR